MQITELKQPKTITINGRIISYNKVETHDHIVEPARRFKISEIPPAEIAQNIIHNAQLMPNGTVEIKEGKTIAQIIDVVGETLIVNNWTFDNVELLTFLYAAVNKEERNEILASLSDSCSSFMLLWHWYSPKQREICLY